MIRVEISEYCNWNTNARKITFFHQREDEREYEALTLWFSYETLVGVASEKGSVVLQNYWGTTTGRHLNEFSDKKERVPSDEFDKKSQQLIAEALGYIGIDTLNQFGAVEARKRLAELDAEEEAIKK